MRRRPSSSTTDEEDDNLAATHVSIPTPAPSSPSPELHTNRINSRQLLLPKPSPRNTRKKSSRLADSSSDVKDPLDLPRPGNRMNSQSSQIGAMAKRSRLRNPWAATWLAVTTLATAIVLMLCLYRSVTLLQLDPKGGSMSYMASSFVRFNEFD